MRQGFTLLEMIIAVFIISLVFAGISTMMNMAVNFTNKARLETIAINLAREGMEGVIIRRNTNWLKWSGIKDRVRLCIDNHCDYSSSLPSGPFFGGTSSVPNIYKISYTGSSHQELIFTALDLGTQEMTPITGTQSSIKLQELQLTSGDFITQDVAQAGNFYRAIIGLGVYDKTSGSSPNTLASTLRDSDPKEFRYCSKVEYDSVNVGEGNILLCGAITNYMQ